jgi:hypothetical protein
LHKQDIRAQCTFLYISRDGDESIKILSPQKLLVKIDLSVIKKILGNAINICVMRAAAAGYAATVCAAVLMACLKLHIDDELIHRRGLCI